MKLDKAATCFAELGHSVRLTIIRELVKAGQKGVNTGELARKAGVPNSTFTHHIKKLELAGLIEREQVSQALVCKGNFELIRELSEYLLQNCCES